MSNISFGRVYAVYLHRMRWPVCDRVGKCWMCVRFFGLLLQLHNSLSIQSLIYGSLCSASIDVLFRRTTFCTHKNNPFFSIEISFLSCLISEVSFLFFIYLKVLNTEFGARAWTFRKSILRDIDFESGNCIWAAFPRMIEITFAQHCSKHICLEIRRDSLVKIYYGIINCRENCTWTVPMTIDESFPSTMQALFYRRQND